ncbi:MAG TPA: DNA-3-methyladenine glycosylase [Candidatus Acidoferrales bacterium]|nr:DNA-3-methyladenine glycosylase [Candidatus Acidoferrales bacterium]
MINASAAVKHLKQADPVMGRAIEQVGPFRLVMIPNRFAALMRAILHQQLALKAAQSITRRFRQLYAPGEGRFPTPEELLRTPRRKLRSAGVSPQKMRYLRDLAAKASDGALPLNRVGRLSDEEVIEALTEVKGIGRWTAEMFLIFSLGRPDVWAVDDLGLQLAAKNLYRLRRHPSEAKMRALAEPWRPWRTVASWYLWQWRRRMIGAGPI